MPGELRRLTPEDWRAWRDLRLAGLADTPIGFCSTLAQESAVDEAGWRAELERPGVRVQALVDGEPVAQAGGYLDGAGCTVFGVFVRPSHRGQGLLARLVDEVAAWAGPVPLRLDVHEDNARALRAYARLGFALDGTTAPYAPAPSRRMLGMSLDRVAPQE